MHLIKLIDYNYWANHRVLDAAARITPEQFLAPVPVSFGSLRGSLVHVLGAEIVWRLRIQEGISPLGLPPESEFPSLDSIVARWQAEEKAIRGYLGSLQPEDYEQVIHYKTSQGAPKENLLSDLLAHLVNHGTQFRAEAAVVLTMYGQSPGDLDLIFYLRERADGR